jgi:outer membrane protein assembly factor BamD
MRLYPLLTALLLCIYCASRQETRVLVEPDEAFEQARSFFEEKKYNQALQAFERILFYYPTSEYVDDAQYWLARTYFANKDYGQSINEFEYLIKNFTTSPFVEDAYFYKAKAFLLKAPNYKKDPTEITNAIEYFDRFLTQFPNSSYTDEVRSLILSARNTLARKELENGKLYVKMGEIDAALLYFDYILNTYPETDVSNEAQYRAAELYERKGVVDKARALYKGLLDDEQWKTKAEERLANLNEETGKSEEENDQ